ncbi:uncharacterized protein CTRU02_215477 [Colletotrichum truncatum]|uniref:Uncharacterized protein n=1 Tax=Colletotrichum truncatum TaxID=5467 RepID=A0ACC3YCP0_COLTU|nr:uncharacterized protein CTRU02_05578 [Colletotrichum truncatum]KAF6794021.1 hypothetical protein CTRU02_05578 [Colletotrichum truncatum]
MEMPQHTTDWGLDSLPARLVTLVIVEMEKCVSRWQQYAASKDAEIFELRRDYDKTKADSELQSRTVASQTMYIRSLEFELMRFRVAAEPLSPGLLDAVNLEVSDSPGSILELQSSVGGESYNSYLPEGLRHGIGQGADQGSNQGIEQGVGQGLDQGLDEGLYPLLALAGAATGNMNANHATVKGAMSSSPEYSPKSGDQSMGGVSKKKIRLA